MKTTIKELPKQFMGKGEVKGMKFTLQIANPRAFVYRVDNGGSEHFEVFLRKIDKRFNQVSYPRSKAFGVWAWAAYTEDRAMARFNSL